MQFYNAFESCSEFSKPFEENLQEKVKDVTVNQAHSRHTKHEKKIDVHLWNFKDHQVQMRGMGGGRERWVSAKLAW